MIENIQRSNLPELDQAEAIARLYKMLPEDTSREKYLPHSGKSCGKNTKERLL